MDLFLSSGEGMTPTVLGPLERAMLDQGDSLHSLEDENRPGSRNVGICFFF
jgi:hypothetical protein